MTAIRKPLINKIFGRLTVTAHLGGRKLACQCECGNRTEVDRGNLVTGRTLSCGCLHKDLHTTHGHNKDYKRTPEYTAWMGLRRRCDDELLNAYPNYGGRGITYCYRWRNFSNFLADMGPRPSPKHSLDRIDNNGDYGPGNCRWATRGEQARNRRTVRILKYQGQQMCVEDWAQHVGINRNTLTKRLRSGWPVERALSVPVQVR